MEENKIAKEGTALEILLDNGRTLLWRKPEWTEIDDKGDCILVKNNNCILAFIYKQHIVAINFNERSKSHVF